MSEGYFCLEKSADLCLNWHKHSSFKSLPIRGAIARLFAFTLFLWTNESLFRVGTKLWKSSERNIKSMTWRSKCSTEDNKQKRSIFRAWQDSNLQSPDPKSGALSIRPHALIDIVEKIQNMYNTELFQSRLQLTRRDTGYLPISHQTTHHST